MHFVVVENNKVTNPLVGKIISHIADNLKTEIKISHFESYTKELNHIIQQEEEKVFILDIALGNISGYDIARIIREDENDWESIIIFISIHQIENKIIHDRLQALTYVSKVSNFEKNLSQAIKKAIHIKTITKKIIINTGKGYRPIALKDIVFIQKEKNSKYCTIETKFTKYRVRNTLANLKSQTSFRKFKKSFLVNPQHILRIEQKQIVFKNGITIS